jgi:hypothetical protein
VRTRSDQLEFLVGFSYAPSSEAYLLGRRISFGVVLAAHIFDEFRGSTEITVDPLTGTPLTLRTFSDPRHPVVSPLVEFNLSPRFSVEGNAIPRSFRGTTKIVNSDRTTPRLFSSSLKTSSTWEFPVLVKYRLTNGRWRPFIALGPSFRLPKEMAGAWLGNYGATAGAGVEIRLNRIKIAPALRYTHWGRDRPRVAGAHAESGVFRNQAQVLVGISF